VSDHDFVFALDLSDPAQLDSMLVEVARAVFVHIGYPAEAAGELTALAWFDSRPGPASSGCWCRAMAAASGARRIRCHDRDAAV
jgi:hypothetical protein